MIDYFSTTAFHSGVVSFSLLVVTIFVIGDGLTWCCRFRPQLLRFFDRNLNLALTLLLVVVLFYHDYVYFET